jgi:predicted nucleotidyltransferase
VVDESQENLDYWAILRTLTQHGVDFIIIGGVCAALHGAPITTFDLDLVHSRAPDNLERLLRGLEELEAYYRGQGERRLPPKIAYLASPGHQLLMTRHGPLDLLGTISGERGYEELLPHTEEIQADDEVRLRVLDLATLIQVKEEAGRDKDKMVLPILRRTLEEKGRTS